VFFVGRRGVCERALAGSGCQGSSRPDGLVLMSLRRDTPRLHGSDTRVLLLLKLTVRTKCLDRHQEQGPQHKEMRHFAEAARPTTPSSVREESAPGTERQREAGTSRGRVGKSGGQEHSSLDLDGGIHSGPSCDAEWRGDGHGSHTGSARTCARDTCTARLEIPMIR
jgi:hypothetical protein